MEICNANGRSSEFLLEFEIDMSVLDTMPTFPLSCWTLIYEYMLRFLNFYY